MIGVVSGSEKVKQHPSFPKIGGFSWKLARETFYSGIHPMTIIDGHSVPGVCTVGIGCNCWSYSMI